MGNTIRFHRRRLGLSQETLAQQIGCKRSTVACYEAGYVTPSLAVAKRLALVLGISMDVLTDDPTIEEIAKHV